MDRTALTDGSGRWFDAEAAQTWKESTRWDGSNHISCATGSQWDHEMLWRTASGLWVLNTYSNRQGVAETYREITAEEAAGWLVRNEHEPADECAKEFAALEM